MLKSVRPWLGMLAIGCIALGCERAEVRAYRVPRAGSVRSTTLPQFAAPARVTWTVPEGWVQDPAPRQFREATFFAEPGRVEVSVAAFAGAAGGVEANINRWRGQIELEPLSAEATLKLLETIEGSNPLVRVVDLNGSQRIIAAIVQPGDGKTWFIKAMGEAEVVGGIRDSLIEFASSIRVGQPPRTDAVTSLRPLNTQSDSIESAVMSWSLPAGWQRAAQSSQMVAVVWTTDAQCRVTLTPLRGQGAELLPSVNMWQAQLGLTPVESLEAVTLEQIGESVAIYDRVSSDGSQRLLAAVITKQDRSWFLKMTGSVSAVENGREAFLDLTKLIDRAEDSGR